MRAKLDGIISALIPAVIMLAAVMTVPVTGILEESFRPGTWGGIRWIVAAEARELPGRPLLNILPAETELGQLGPGGMRRGSVMLTRSGPGNVEWSLIAPDAWGSTDEKTLAGVLRDESEPLRFQLKIYGNGSENRGDSDRTTYTAQLTFETDHSRQIFTRKIKPGPYRELVRLHTGDGPKSFFIRYAFVDAAAEPLLSVEPQYLDLGRAVRGEPVSRRVKVTNIGWDTLRWRAVPGVSQRALGPGQYVSFLSQEAAGSGRYKMSQALKDRLELTGNWAEDQGHPLSLSETDALRFHFSGTGIAVYFWKGPTTGQLTAFVDDRFIFQQEGFSEQRERFEWDVAAALADGPHVLTLISRNGPVAIEGVRIYGEGIARLAPGYMTIQPDHGIVTRQTNYVNIVVDTRTLPPGQYAGQVVFDSNGGQKELEITLHVTAETGLRTLDVYRYVRGSDYFLTTNPQAESDMLSARGYTKQGIAFRLFSPGVPGTTEFHRWFNPATGDHFYGYDLESVKRPMQGYVPEGTIGNIATSRLAQTRELYRWYHPGSRHYFFTVDPKGEGIEKKGYRYDGIAGYVKP